MKISREFILGDQTLNSYDLSDGLSIVIRRRSLMLRHCFAKFSLSLFPRYIAKCHQIITLGAKGFISRALISLVLHASYVSYICAARQAAGQERDFFDSAEAITISLIRKHPESGCFADWLMIIS